MNTAQREVSSLLLAPPLGPMLQACESDDTAAPAAAPVGPASVASAPPDPRITGPFQLGARGACKSQGMESAFEVTALVDQGSYTRTCPLPGGALVIRRSFESDISRAVFTHRVQLTGDGGAAIAPMLGPGFRAALPRARDALRRLAEGR